MEVQDRARDIGPGREFRGVEAGFGGAETNLEVTLRGATVRAVLTQVLLKQAAKSLELGPYSFGLF